MNILQTVFVLAATTLLPYAAAQPLRHGSGTGSDASGIGSKFIAVSDAVAEPLGGPDPPGVLVGPSTHDARQRKRDVEEDGAKDGYGPASIEPHHQDDALDVDGVGGELTADASYCWRSNQRGGYACCVDSNCRSNVCITAICRDCRYDSDCRGSDKYCTGFTEGGFTEGYVCKKKGGIGDGCDVTGVTNGNGSRPCGDGLSCYYAGGLDHKCMPSGTGSCVETLMEIARDDIGDRYASVTDAISDVIDNSWESAEDLANAVMGDDFLFNRIKDIACGTNDLVGRWSQIVHDSCGGETDMKLGATETQGLDGKEEKDSSLVVLVGAEVDSTYLISGLSVSFGVAVEISTEPNVALFVTGCMGPSVGGAAGGFGSVGLQFGGGLGATAGHSTDAVSAKVVAAAGAGITIGFADPPSYPWPTISVEIGGGAAADVDIAHKCWTWTTPSARQLASIPGTCPDSSSGSSSATNHLEPGN